ncbi:hypothetical protein AAG570_002392 [Ranatra chinensis]|uniref:Uncharacterized protein n=1 Tax=Ranatra chinensis TaxID=642074 RepID=A0ABD0Y7W2_9HEMI
MEIISKLKSRWKTCYSYIHSFGMTDRWIVFIEQPLLVKGLKLLTAHLNRKTMRDCSEWCPEEKNVFYIIDKSTGKVLPIEYESEKSFFVFHHINAYEEDNHLVVDVIGQDKPEILDNMFLDMLRNSDCKHGNKGSVWRFVLPLAENIKDLPENQNLVGLKYSSATATRKDDTVIVNYEIFTEPAYELPTVNRAFNGKPYKYFYAGGLHDESVYKNCIIKVNLETKEVTTWKDSEYCFSGPTEFISRPGAVQEDDGVLLTAVTDIRHDRRGYLVILDAATMTEIARAQVTEHVPCAVHGLFLPNLE